MVRKHSVIALLASVLFTFPVMPASAQAPTAYPDRPIKIVMPVPPGTALDVVTRVVAEHMAGALGQPVVVEPRPGAGGLLAAQAVASATSDGYTVLGGAAGIFTILPGQNEKLPLDVSREFTHAGMIVGRGAMFVAVPASLGVKNFAEFAALAKAKPNQIVIGTNGAGTLPHYAGLLLQRKAGLPVTLVPYNQGGTPAVVADVLGGRVQAIIEASFGLRGQLQSGDLKLIGVLADERDPEFPEVPTIAETFPGLTAVGFMSLAVPAKTPEAIVRRLNEGFKQGAWLACGQEAFRRARRSGQHRHACAGDRLRRTAEPDVAAAREGARRALRLAPNLSAPAQSRRPDQEAVSDGTSS